MLLRVLANLYTAVWGHQHACSHHMLRETSSDAYTSFHIVDLPPTAVCTSCLSG